MAYNYRDEYGRQRGSEQRGSRDDEQHGPWRESSGRGRDEWGPRRAQGSAYGSPQWSGHFETDRDERGHRAESEDFSGREYGRRYGARDYGPRDVGQEQGGWGGSGGYGEDERGRGFRQGGYGGYGQSGSGYRGGQGRDAQGEFGQGGFGQSGHSRGGFDYGRGEFGQSGYGDTRRGYGQSDSYSQQFQRRGKAPKGYKRTDERIKEDLYERLMNQDIDAAEVTVEVQSGKVQLEGTVPERWMKHVVEDVADGCPGVEDVENRIRVQSQSGEGTGASTSAYGTTSASASIRAKKE